MHAQSLSPVRLCNPMDCSSAGSCPWDFPGKNTGAGGHALLQGISPTQGLNLHLCIAGVVFTTEPAGKPSKWMAEGKDCRHQTLHRTTPTLCIKREEKRHGLRPLGHAGKMTRVPRPTQAPTAGTLSMLVGMNGFE